MRTLAAVLFTIGVVAGCAPPNREALTKEVLRADPAFKEILDKHRDFSNRIQTYERELALKRTTIEQSIAQLRKDLASATAHVNSRTDELKRRMDPDRQRLELALSMAGEELRAKRAQRASLGRSIAQLKKALSASRGTWTDEERARQEAQIQDMLRDGSRLDQERAALHAHMRLLKIKLRLIKL
ncbi:MAG: hypothetical protein HYZ91_00215 [Candidatus Omnitrophica bacterium]|nr:hypothetical protein [Candidatus Omnitrophota bacterium]